MIPQLNLSCIGDGDRTTNENRTYLYRLNEDNEKCFGTTDTLSICYFRKSTHLTNGAFLSLFLFKEMEVMRNGTKDEILTIDEETRVNISNSGNFLCTNNKTTYCEIITFNSLTITDDHEGFGVTLLRSKISHHLDSRKVNLLYQIMSLMGVI